MFGSGFVCILLPLCSRTIIFACAILWWAVGQHHWGAVWQQVAGYLAPDDHYDDVMMMTIMITNQMTVQQQIVENLWGKNPKNRNVVIDEVIICLKKSLW